MIKTVIFDMDGVIVDTEPLHHKAYYKMFEDLDIQVPETLYQSFTGQSTITVCKNLCQHFKLKNAPEELMKIKRFHFKKIFENDPSLELINGVENLIKEYYNNKLTLVLASSASMSTINNVFARFNLDQYFLAKLSGADLKASKPHPEIFLNAAKISGNPVNKCIVIEDSTNGVKAANAANIFCVAYKSINSKNQDYSTANLVIKDFSEISINNLKKVFTLR